VTSNGIRVEEQRETPATGGSSERRYLVIFVSDFHGQLEGVELGSLRWGGVTSLIRSVRILVNTAEFGSERKYDGVYVCLGGDMIRHRSSRFVHERNAADVWRLLEEKLRPDAYVLGNHELQDFHDALLEILEVAPVKNCTLNLTPKNAAPASCWVRQEAAASESSIRTPLGPHPPCLVSVGLATVKTQVWSGNLTNQLVYRRPEDAAKEVLLLGCLNGCPRPERKIVILLAHFDDDRHPYVGPNLEDQFGTWWRDFLNEHGIHLKDGRIVPHFVFKAHDHTLSPRDEGQVTPEDFRVGNKTRTKPPTFGAGCDGLHIGKLELTLRPDTIDYKWETELVPRAMPLAGKFAELVPELVAPGDGDGSKTKPTSARIQTVSPDATSAPSTQTGTAVAGAQALTPEATSPRAEIVVLGTQARSLEATSPPTQSMVTGIPEGFPEFGGDPTQPDRWYRALCLLLRGILDRYKENDNKENDNLLVAITPTSAVVQHSLLPASCGISQFTWEQAQAILSNQELATLTKDKFKNSAAAQELVRMAWQRRLELFDLQRVFGDWDLQVYGPQRVEQLVEAIHRALSSRQLRPAPVPPTTGTPPDSQPAQEVACCMRICCPQGISTLLVRVPRAKNDPELYELVCDPAGERADRSFSLVPHSTNLAEFLRSRWPKENGKVYVTTSKHYAKLLGEQWLTHRITCDGNGRLREYGQPTGKHKDDLYARHAKGEKWPIDLSLRLLHYLRHWRDQKLRGESPTPFWRP
jgi:hypothetical protein